MTVAILGSKGFVGQYLTATLRDQGEKIVEFNLRDGQDLRRFEDVRSFFTTHQPDYCYLLAAQAFVPESTMNPYRGIDINIVGTLNVLEAMRQTGSQARLLLTSTSEVYGYEQPGLLTEESPVLPSTPYGVTKLAGEQLAVIYSRLLSQNNVVVTRAFNHSGPGSPAVYAVPSFAKRVAEVEAGKSKKVVHGNLVSVRNFSDVRDIVRAYVLAIQLPSGIYNVCSDNTVNMQYVLDTLCELAEVDIPTEVSDALYREASSQFPIPSCEKLKKATGWEPEIPFRQTLQDVLDYYRRNL